MCVGLFDRVAIPICCTDCLTITSSEGLTELHISNFKNLVNFIFWDSTYYIQPLLSGLQAVCHQGFSNRPIFL